LEYSITKKKKYLWQTSSLLVEVMEADALALPVMLTLAIEFADWAGFTLGLDENTT